MKSQTLFWFCVLCLCVGLCEVLCPYTKVEESFGMQAMHDFLFCPTTDCGDHIQFPGVVPRTFIGPWLVVLLALSLVVLVLGPVLLTVRYICLQLGLISYIKEEGVMWEHFFMDFEILQNPLLYSHTCRLVLGLLVCITLMYAATGIDVREKEVVKSKVASQREKKKQNNKCSASSVFIVLCMTQFHLMFYATRTLPNTYGLILGTFACGCTLRGLHYRSIALLTVTAAVFRCDAIIFLASYVCILLLQGKGRITHFVMVFTSCLVIAVSCSVVVDSFLWGRWLWPEGTVFLFNTVENNSWRWGRLPWHWYATVAMPRALLGMYIPLLLMVAVICCDSYRSGRHCLLRFFNSATLHTSPSSSSASSVSSSSSNETFLGCFIATSLRYRDLLLPATLFISLYSFLPHKELRFIMIVFPYLLVPLAAVLSIAWNECILSQEMTPTGVTRKKKLVSTKHPAERDMKKNNVHHCRGYFKGMERHVRAILCGLLFLQLMSVVVSVYVSVYNYPGAYALNKLHNSIEADIHNVSSCVNRLRSGVDEKNKSITIFIDAYAAMTGITRFQKIHYPFSSDYTVDKVGYTPLCSSLSLGRRLVALLGLPFVAFFRIAVEGQNASLGRWQDYDYLNTCTTPRQSSMHSDCMNILQSSAPSKQWGGMRLHYTKDPTRFDEEHGVYNDDGLDYLLVRYSQREIHRQRGELEEMFIVRLPGFRSLVNSWVKHLYMRKQQNDGSSEELGEPYIVALRRRCDI